LIETVSANQPRFDYDPVTGECRGLLIEESRQNLLTYSEDFATTWSRNNYNISTNAITAPDGVLTADKLITINASPIHDLFKTPSLGSNTYTLSIFAKAAEQNLIRLRIDDGIIGRNVIFNLTSGSISSSTNVTSSTITPYPNGWYRCSITVTTNIINVVFNTPYPYSGDGTSGLYIWGAQLQTGAFPTSYIPTSASTVTRSADLASMTGTNFSSWYNQSEGTLYADLNNITTRTSITFDRLVALVGTDVNRDVISICTQTASGGGAQNKFLAGVSYSPDGSYVLDTFTGAVSGGGGPDRVGKAILSYKKNDFLFTVSGITPLRDIAGDIPICNRLLIFGASRFQPAPSGHIKRLTYYPRTLKPNQLQYLTQ
jgi:hypothetical protein